MSDQGKANYEGYCAAMPGSKPVPFEELPYADRLRWDAGACSVELWLAEAPVDEDAPGNEPAKVIVVRDALGRDQLFAADSWDAEDAIDITRNGDVIATYPPGRWQRVHKDGALVPFRDSAGIALAIAKRALEAVTRVSDPNVAVKLATVALEDIFTETEQ